MQPVVSINLCCYNSEKYLRETLDSIVNQTFKDWELIIINDGSTDSTELIIKEYIRQGYPIIYHYQENCGLGYSRNKALEYSNGQYIAFIDHDDLWLSEKLEKQVRILGSQSSVDFVYTNYFKMIVYKNNRLIKALKRNQPQGFVFETFIHKYEVCLSTVMITRKVLTSLDTLFDSRLVLMEEYDLFLRILYKSKAFYMNEVTTIYRFHDKMTTLMAPVLVLKEYPHLIENLAKLDLPSYIVKHMNIRWVLYNKAKYSILKGDSRQARKYITIYKWYCLKTFLLYLVSFLPNKLCVFLYNNLLFSRGRI